VNELRTCHLFAGIGGGLLADLILGHRPVVAVEWEPYACQVLRERAAEGWFPELEVYEGDVRAFDGRRYKGRVDCIHAGFPCQDLSNAGSRAGLGDGTRSGLYREVLRIAREIRPRFIFLENVSAILSSGLDRVLSDIAEMGMDARWCCIRASDVSAPHPRDRWFLLASNSYEVRQHISEFHKEKHDFRDIWDQGEFFALLDSCDTWEDDERGYSVLGDGLPGYVGAVAGYGNAQVPLQAATAWKLLGGE
jgi:DNA (cytosine-5)-methyltransferase 1